MKTLLILSHGQATVESGFSINKEIMDTNMKLLTLTSRRRLREHLKHIGGVKNVLITDELYNECEKARKRLVYRVTDIRNTSWCVNYL